MRVNHGEEDEDDGRHDADDEEVVVRGGDQVHSQETGEDAVDGDGGREADAGEGPADPAAAPQQHRHERGPAPAAPNHMMAVWRASALAACAGVRSCLQCIACRKWSLIK